MFAIRFFKVDPKAAQIIEELKSCENSADYQKLLEKFEREKFSDVNCDLLETAFAETATKLNAKFEAEIQKDVDESNRLRLDRVRRIDGGGV